MALVALRLLIMVGASRLSLRVSDAFDLTLKLFILYAGGDGSAIYLGKDRVIGFKLT